MGGILRHSAATLAFVTSFVTCVWIVLTFTVAHGWGNDFSVYWRVANGPVSDAYSTTPAFPFPYAPTMLIWIQPLSFIPLVPALIGWVALSLTAYVAIARRFLRRRELMSVLVSPVIVAGLITGQVSIMLGALMLWSFATDRRLVAGVALGLIASIKPQLVALAPILLLIRRDWSAFFGAGAGFALVVAASLIAFGTQPWIDWVHSLGHFRAVLNDQHIINGGVTPASLADRIGVSPVPFMIVGAAAGLWLIFRFKHADVVTTSAAVCCASLLFVPYAMVYDFVPILPFLAILVWKESYPAAFALAHVMPPLPTILSAWELAASARKQKRPGD
nr:glycosyltransferase family 87 protein [uncultured Sphingomonas sp.]